MLNLIGDATSGDATFQYFTSHVKMYTPPEEYENYYIQLLARSGFLLPSLVGEFFLSLVNEAVHF